MGGGAGCRICKLALNDSRHVWAETIAKRIEGKRSSYPLAMVVEFRHATDRENVDGRPRPESFQHSLFLAST